MKSSWVSNVTEFFENFHKQNFRHSFRKKRASMAEVYKRNVSINSQSAEQPPTDDSDGSEHCCTVQTAKGIFDNHNSAATKSDERKSQFPFRGVSSFDIFSGIAVDHDIPPIEAEIEEDGVYPRADISPIASKMILFGNGHQIVKRPKNVMKSNSYAARRTNYKRSKDGKNCFVNHAGTDRENEGVFIRMRNQESYYDGQDKYQSQLPEGPLYQVYENTHLRRSRFAHKPFDTIDSAVGIDNDDGARGSRMDHELIQNSIIYPDMPLPVLDSTRLAGREDDSSDSIDLEPSNNDNDMYPDTRVFQLFSENSQRLRWAETEEGKKLIVMQKLSEDKIKWQEAQFELITSEASYYRSLEVLVNKIYKSPLLDCEKEKRNTCDVADFNGPLADCDECHSPTVKTSVISATQKHHLFSNILEIHIVSGELLKALESRWREDPFIIDLSDIIIEFCKEKLKPYVTYLRNQRYQTDTYNKLLNVPEFVNIIKIFENDPECAKMNLCSFLLLPMQRVLRLKLLMSTVKHYIPKDMSSAGCDMAIEELEKLIKECSNEKMVMEQKEQILLICNRLIIKDKMKGSIGSKPLLKNGQLRLISNNSIASKSLGSGFMRRNHNRAQLYLFEDQLIIARQKKVPLCVSSSEDREVVIDNCPRSEVKFVDVSASANATGLTSSDGVGASSPIPVTKLVSKHNSLAAPSNNFKLVLTHGRKGCAEYACTADSQKEFNDWKSVFSPDSVSRDEFDFNEVYVVKDYIPKSDKEIELKKGQILNIVERIDQNRVIASSGESQGEVLLSHVQFVSTPTPLLSSPGLVKEVSSTSFAAKRWR